MDRKQYFCPICRQGTLGHNGRTWVPCGCVNTDETYEAEQKRRDNHVAPEVVENHEAAGT